MVAGKKEAAFYNSLNILFDGSYAKLSELHKKHKSWEEAWNSVPSKKDVSPIPDGIDLVLWEDPRYPAILKEIPNPPWGIYIKGIADFSGISIAIVGTRKITFEGKRSGYDFSKALASKGISIISGLAFGLDKSAHEGALDAGGRTIAVLANGLNSVYPKTNEPLAEKIIQKGGALISEYHPNLKPLPFRFLERNRIVSGLSKGIIVIEAPRESGSLATARFALEQNRDVFVLPGPSRHPNYKGSHALIRSGATLVTCPEDILEEYGLDARATSQRLPFASSEEKIILDILNSAGRSLGPDEIASLSGLDIQNTNKALSFLLIKAYIKEDGSKYCL